MKSKNGHWNPKFVPTDPSPLSSPVPKGNSIRQDSPVNPIKQQAATPTASAFPSEPHHTNDPSHDHDDDTFYDHHHDDYDDTHTYKHVPPEFLGRLATFPLFNKAPKSFHSRVASKLTLVQYHPQEFIIKRGDPSKSMYWILKGTVSVASTDGESVYAELAAGSFFGEIGILFNRPRTATVVARTKVLVGVLTSEALNTVLKHYPSIERRIRDEAQERLAMQEKKKMYDLPNLISKTNNNNIQHLLEVPSPQEALNSLPPIANKAINASVLANQASRLPGPSLPPITHVPSPLSASTTANSVSTSDNVDASVSIQDFITSLPVFQNMSASIIHQVALDVEPFNVKAFEYIFHKGDTDSDIYFIINGEVEVIDFVTDPKTGKETELVLARLQAGSYFGEMSFLSFLDESETITRSKSIRSVSSVELMVIRSESLKSLCSKYPSFVEKIKKTAQERNRSNNEKESKELEHSRLSINYLINADRRADRSIKQPQPKPKLTPSILESVAPLPVTSPSLFSPNWEFNLSGNGPGRLSRSISPISNSEPPASSVSSGESRMDLQRPRNDMIESSMHNKSSVDNNFQKKRRASTISTKERLDESLPQLTVPSLNPVVPSLNNFQNFQFNYTSSTASNRNMFQYLPHNKRMRLASVSNGRRRSSILSNNGRLPDRILLKIFEFLPLPTLMKLRVLNKRWRQLLYAAPNLFQTLDLTPWNTSIDDEALIQICDFVGSRPEVINISNCFHITDEGFSYMVNEIGIAGKVKVLRMKSNWEVSAMSIMDLTVPSVGQHLEEIDLSNCRKVRDNVLERLIGWDSENQVEEADFDAEQIGCKNLKILNVGYCKHLTDNFMFHIANHANRRLESLDLTRCTTITDTGFQYWTYRSFPNLKKLSLKDCTFLTDKAIISIANAATNLEILDLNFCCALSNIAIEVLCLGCPNIRELDLSFCGSAVSDSSLVAISLNLRKLEKLILTGCIRVTRAGVDALLSGCSPLNYMNISQCKNAHIYPGRIPAQKLNVNHQTKSAFVTAGPYQNIIEIVI